MRLLPTRSCQPGMRLGKPIFNEDGVILLGAQVELTQNLIYRLQQLGIDYLYIHDPDTSDVDIIDPLSDETRLRAITEIRSNFRSMMEENSKTRVAKHPVLGKSFSNVLNMIIDDLVEHKNTLIMMMNMNVMNTYLYQHSLNVTIITTTLGIIHGYSRNDLYTLALGSMMHDIGKTKIRQDILSKPGSLTEEEFKEVQKHTVIGYQMLKDAPGVPLIAAHCAFQHHERMDGSGYPRGIKGNEIHDFAQWIAIADSYDAMTTHRAHRLAMLPHQSLEVLFACAGTLYDRKKVALFRDNVAIYPIGLTVKLNTGEKGVVVSINPAYPQRPVVRVFQLPDGSQAAPIYEIDLSQKLTVMVDSVDM
ncbi:MAG: HD-GYP domain-containing protein [Paenibacillaceae bacterium]|nr:HD-GYP domain-containing protein [Paenibacillaceae bacterium]